MFHLNSFIGKELVSVLSSACKYRLILILIIIERSVAALTKVLARASGETRAESLLHEIASWWLLGCGIVYIVAVSSLAPLTTTTLNCVHHYLGMSKAEEDCNFSNTHLGRAHTFITSYVLVLS